MQTVHVVRGSRTSMGFDDYETTATSIIPPRQPPHHIVWPYSHSYVCTLNVYISVFSIHFHLFKFYLNLMFVRALTEKPTSRQAQIHRKRHERNERNEKRIESSTFTEGRKDDGDSSIVCVIHIKSTFSRCALCIACILYYFIVAYAIR